MESDIKSPHGHTWKVEVISSEDISPQLDALKAEVNNSFLFNVKDRILLDVFKANGFKVIEFNDNPTPEILAEWICKTLSDWFEANGYEQLKNAIKQVSVHNIIFIPDDKT